MRDKEIFISIDNYDYLLPDEKIARFPLEKRDQSKLLLFEENKPAERVFHELPDLLPDDTLMVFNDSKVIPARLIFEKESGSVIEIFCLEPFERNSFEEVLSSRKPVRWNALVGNSKRWKSGTLRKKWFSGTQEICLNVDRIEKKSDHSVVEFSWEASELSFAEVIESAGKVPLPPYLKRDVVQSDKERYQTVYARLKGSVAAPTAGLHFTGELMQNLRNKGVGLEYVTLHVGAGTFRPVCAENAVDHPMHTERISFSYDFVEKLTRCNAKPLLAVGTTSVRSLESLYWIGVKLMQGSVQDAFRIGKTDPYLADVKIPLDKALEEVLRFFDTSKNDTLFADTSIMIFPSYKYRLVDWMLTNFHQPKSTLLLLVAAFIGSGWKEAYQFALKNEFRFLSYGDSCLFKKQSFSSL